jgi:ankyrin repeat protein
VRNDLELAAFNGDIDELAQIIADGADIDARNKYGMTPLMIAATRGHGPLTEWLIEHGADLDHTAKYGLSALMLAVVYGHLDMVEALAKAGARTDILGTGAPGFQDKTALDLARDRRDEAMIGLLSDRTHPHS